MLTPAVCEQLSPRIGDASKAGRTIQARCQEATEKLGRAMRGGDQEGTIYWRARLRVLETAGYNEGPDPDIEALYQRVARLEQIIQEGRITER